MTDPLTKISTRRTHQGEQADARQIRNTAGGWVFPTTDDVLLHRFLTIGTTGGTYYIGEKPLTKDTAAVVINMAKTRPLELVERIREVSLAGRAPKQDQGIFALAIAASLSDDEGRHAAINAVSDVCRTGTTLFQFVKYAEQFRGWGYGLRRAVRTWFENKDATEQLAYQMVKYRQREGWAQADLLRLAHPRATSPAHAALYDMACGRGVTTALPNMAAAYQMAQAIGKPAEDMSSGKNMRRRAYVQLLTDYPGLPWEALPTEALSMPEVWETLISNGMPMTALIRQLPRLSNLDVLKPMSGITRMVCDQLTDAERIRKARVHPIALLLAARTYQAGRSARGSSTWVPSGLVVDALSEAFYLAFEHTEPSGKRIMLNCDISGSMGMPVGGLPLTCREVAGALALVRQRTEQHTATFGFCTSLRELNISRYQRLDDVCRYMNQLPMGGTDCAQPMLWAAKNNVEVDTFEVVTDYETWAGSMHPYQALRQYREKMGINARLSVMAITPTRFSFAEPGDPGTLDVSGFDSAVPALLSDFSRGDV